MQPETVIVDYGMGNLFSLQRAINYLGGKVLVSQDPDVVSCCQHLILPGVGAFGDGMENLKRLNLVEAIKKFVKSGNALLGICLGMQLFMDESGEFGRHTGLGLVSGKVQRLEESKADFCKIPHVGWNKLIGTGWKGTILENIPEGSFVYFVHSYAVNPDSDSDRLADTIYGDNRFCSVLRHENIFGCQFHPEVSAGTGLEILRRFLFKF